MAGTIVPVEPFDLVVFGATGDLAKRKLIPGLYHRFRDGQMPPEARIIAAARRPMTADVFRNLADAALTEFVPADQLDRETRKRFLACLDYVAVDATGDDGWDALSAQKNKRKK